MFFITEWRKWESIYDSIHNACSLPSPSVPVTRRKRQSGEMIKNVMLLWPLLLRIPGNRRFFFNLFEGCKHCKGNDTPPVTTGEARPSLRRRHYSVLPRSLSTKGNRSLGLLGKTHSAVNKRQVKWKQLTRSAHENNTNQLLN